MNKLLLALTLLLSFQSVQAETTCEDVSHTAQGIMDYRFTGIATLAESTKGLDEKYKVLWFKAYKEPLTQNQEKQSINFANKIYIDCLENGIETYTPEN